MALQGVDPDVVLVVLSREPVTSREVVVAAKVAQTELAMTFGIVDDFGHSRVLPHMEVLGSLSGCTPKEATFKIRGHFLETCLFLDVLVECGGDMPVKIESGSIYNVPPDVALQGNAKAHTVVGPKEDVVPDITAGGAKEKLFFVAGAVCTSAGALKDPTP